MPACPTGWRAPVLSPHRFPAGAAAVFPPDPRAAEPPAADGGFRSRRSPLCRRRLDIGVRLRRLRRLRARLRGWRLWTRLPLRPAFKKVEADADGRNDDQADGIRNTAHQAGIVFASVDSFAGRSRVVVHRSFSICLRRLSPRRRHSVTAKPQRSDQQRSHEGTSTCTLGSGSKSCSRAPPARCRLRLPDQPNGFTPISQRVQEKREQRPGRQPDDEHNGIPRPGARRITRARCAIAPTQRSEIDHRPQQEGSEQDHRRQRAVREQMRERPGLHGRNHRVPDCGFDAIAGHVRRSEKYERRDSEQRSEMPRPRRRRPEHDRLRLRQVIAPYDQRQPDRRRQRVQPLPGVLRRSGRSAPRRHPSPTMRTECTPRKINSPSTSTIK